MFFNLRPQGSQRRPQEPSRDPFCQRKALQPRILPPENLSAPGFGLGKGPLTAADLEAEAFSPPEIPPTPSSATGKPLNAGFWLGKNLSDCFRSGGRGRRLGGRGLVHPCESPLGNLATVRVAHPGLVSGCQIWVLNKYIFLEVVPAGLLMEG